MKPSFSLRRFLATARINWMPRPRWRVGMVLRCSLTAVAAIPFGFLPAALAQAPREYDLKAVLLYNFFQFVEWPSATSARPDAPWVIGILGRDPFGKTLDNVVRTETHLNRRIVVERYRSIEAVRDCHILFVGESEAGNLARILTFLRHRPILTVSDSEGFALQGGMIRFKKNAEGKTELRVNLPAVKESGLVVSGKLLRAAEVISEPVSLQQP